MHCYCANYYGAVNCTNKVPHFGERCRLCTIMNEGQSAQYEVMNTTSSSTSSYPESSSSSSMRCDSSREDRRGRTRERKSNEMRHPRQQS